MAPSLAASEDWVRSYAPSPRGPCPRAATPRRRASEDAEAQHGVVGCFKGARSHENLYVDVWRAASPAKIRRSPSDVFLESMIEHEMRPLEALEEAVGFAKWSIGRGSFVSSVFTLVASAMGAGCLSLPHMFRQSGLALGCLLLAVGALLAHVSLVVLMSCARYTRCRSFAEVVSFCIGNPAESKTRGRSLSVDLVIALYGMAAVLIYLILIGDFLGSIAESPLFGLEGLSRRSLILGSLVLLLPLSLPRSVTALRYISILSTSSIAFLTVVVLLKTPGLAFGAGRQGEVNAAASADVAAPGGSDGLFWFAGTPGTTLRSLAIAIFAFNAHTNAVPVAVALEDARAASFWHVSLASVLIEFMIYTLIATGGYLSFLGETQQDFIRNYPADDVLMLVVRCVYAVPVVFGVPINLSPAAASLQAFARRALLSSSATRASAAAAAREAAAGPSVGNKSRLLSAVSLIPRVLQRSERASHAAIVVGVLVVCTTFAIWVEAVADVIGLMGGFFGTLICLWWPLRIYRRVLGELHAPRLATAIVSVLWGATVLGVMAFVVQAVDVLGDCEYLRLTPTSM